MYRSPSWGLDKNTKVLTKTTWEIYINTLINPLYLVIWQTISPHLLGFDCLKKIYICQIEVDKIGKICYLKPTFVWLKNFNYPRHAKVSKFEDFFTQDCRFFFLPTWLELHRLEIFYFLPWGLAFEKSTISCTNLHNI